MRGLFFLFYIFVAYESTTFTINKIIDLLLWCEKNARK